MNDSMISHDPSYSTGELIFDLSIIGLCMVSDRIYDILLFFVNQDMFHATIIDLKDVFGLLVGILGSYLMIIKIKRAKKKENDTEEKK